MTICVLMVSCGGNQASLEVWLKNNPFVYHMVGNPPIMEVRREGGAISRIYIEGDGKAFRGTFEPSGDPTPENPVGLRLFLADGSGTAAYLGRPCMWGRTAVCRDRGIWTTKRFTQPVVELYTEEVARLSRGGPVELVGYSGGAFLALQVAARLPNVTSVRTVAGNVDPAEVNRIHGVSAMEVVGWPEGGGRLHEVPQVHFVGSADKVVVGEVVRHYLAEVKPLCAKVVTVEASHGEGWVEKWPELVREESGCDRTQGTGAQATGFMRKEMK